MSLPKKLKMMSVFNNGGRYVTECKSFTLPKLGRKMEEYRAGGMRVPVKIDHGMEMLECEQEYGGFMEDFMKQWGEPTVDGVQLRFMGSYQNDGTGGVSSVEIVMRGRHEEIEGGEAKVGEDTTFKVKTALAYYKCTVDGVPLIEIDALTGTEIVNGLDRTAALRAGAGG